MGGSNSSRILIPLCYHLDLSLACKLRLQSTGNYFTVPTTCRYANKRPFPAARCVGPMAARPLHRRCRGVFDCGRFCGWYPKGRVRRFSFSHVFVEGSPARVLESTIQCIHETKKSTDTYAFVEGWMVVMLAVRMQDTAHVGGGSFRY